MRQLTDGEREILNDLNRDAMPCLYREAWEIAEALALLVDVEGEHDEGFGTDLRVDTYADAGVLTRDAGFVLSVNGREFQITVVRSA